MPTLLDSPNKTEKTNSNLGEAMTVQESVQRDTPFLP